MKKLFLLISMVVMIAMNMTAKPQINPIDTVDIVCYDLVLNTDFIDLFGMAYIFANNSEYKLTGAILADSIPPGTYSDCYMDLTHIATNAQIPAKTVCITLDRDANNYCVITGFMVGEDNVLYNLDLSWQTPSIKDTVKLIFNNSSRVAYYPDLGHDFMLSNENDLYDISIDIMQVPMGEYFTEKNLNTSYCLIANKETKDTIKIAAAEGRVWQSNDTTYLSTKVTGFDSVLYDIQLWYSVPEVRETRIIEIPQATFYNELESDGYFALVGTTANGEYEFAISLLGNTEDEVPGEYVNDGLFGGFTGIGYDFLHFIGGQYTTYIAKWNESKKDYDVISIEKGKTIVEMDEDQNVSLRGSFIGADAVEYQVTLSTKIDKPRIIDDATEGAVDRVYIDENEFTIEQLEEDKIRLEIMSGTDLLAMWFYVEYIDDEIIIPEGEYLIDDSNDYWSVIAADGSLGKTFYATHDGEYFTSFYFLVSGMVDISKKEGKLHFEINALNSYDVPVHIVYAPTTTSVENLSVENSMAKKVIKNGQFFIIRNGVRYSTLGTQLQ